MLVTVLWITTDKCRQLSLVILETEHRLAPV